MEHRQNRGEEPVPVEVSSHVFEIDGQIRGQRETGPRLLGCSQDQRHPPGALGSLRHASSTKDLGDSVFQAKFFKGVHIEKVELEAGQSLRRKSFDSPLDLGRQRAELLPHHQQGRSPHALFDATFVCGLHERLDTKTLGGSSGW